MDYRSPHKQRWHKAWRSNWGQRPYISKKDFFMYFQWWDNAGISGCVNIDPQWPETTIFIDANGRIDLNVKGATDVKRFSPCPGGEDPDFLGLARPVE
ncbi:Uncharacterized protein ALO70_03189 [Pseudomonas amygdali pv. eriobotryae]|uniref:Uncharacterized protein n=2 Tax=Pseudomonas syringae group TaxID=136849 RepID=A0A0P9PUL9_PSEA0|nr:Uncharacterized protein ALO70_03189 [Pseudomonas amygdali pv. eriobotryae]RMO62232.1 hypothetical protein ALQ39_04404 [Pseudomonas amygdali pv. eriobotryae]RMR62620.1 hypothetical protein ALP83_100337 [Pseudomonas syringae pv. actinidiae]